MCVRRRTLILLFLLLFLARPEMVSQSSVSAQEGPPVLAFYYAWFDQNTWNSGQSVDLPAEPYHSADRATIERHVAQAQSAGIDAFVQSWYGPQEAGNQTETNFRTLLEVAQAKGFQAAVDFETSGPFFGDASAVTNALATLLATHAQHPAYLRYQGKPVIFFWRQQRFSVGEWTAIRSQVDPNRNSYWIAEGVDLSYQAIFDGHHLYSIAWASSPADELTKWGNRVRAYAADNGLSRLWVATTMPGYDDTRQLRANVFAVPRRNGDYYRDTWRGALASQPHLIIVNSFNEWLEGTQIEPSAAYGNLYLDVTRELVTALRGNPPSAPPVAPVATELPLAETPPAGPYIKAFYLTNVRSGPALDFERIGQLAAGSLVSVTGRIEAGDWWQIDFKSAPTGKGWVAAEVVEFAGEPSALPLVQQSTPAATTTATTVRPTRTATRALTRNSTATRTAKAAPEPTDEPTPTTTPTPSLSISAGGVNVRSGPGLEFDLLGRLEEDTSVVVVGKDKTGEWWQIEYEDGRNDRAWVAAAVVDFSGNGRTVPVITPPATATATPTVTPTPTPFIAGSIEITEPINVRDEPSLEGALLGGLYAGDSADVLAVSPDGDWWHIEFADSPDGTGWVAAEFARFQGERELVPIFGQGTPTPTPGPTKKPTAPPPQPSPTPFKWPTYAPTATSIYQPTAIALLASRGTPDPALLGLPAKQPAPFDWMAVPWGLLSGLVVILFFWYQLFYRRRFRQSEPEA